MSYKVASELNQKRALRNAIIQNDMYEEKYLSTSEQRGNLVKKVETLQELVVQAEGETKKRIGLEIAELTKQITALNKYKHKLNSRTMLHILYEIIQKSVTKAQFDIWVKMAKEEQQRLHESEGEIL